MKAGLNINANFDSSITTNKNAAEIMATINHVIDLYEASFSDHIDININFGTMTSGLGESYVASTNLTYSALRADLVAGATTDTDATALAHLPTGKLDPVLGG